MENTIYSQFISTVEQNKNEPAIITDNNTLTFEELSNMVDTISSNLLDNIHSVGIVMSHGAEMIASILAILKKGAMYVPAEPTFPIKRIHYMMQEAQVNFVLTEKQYSDKFTDTSLIYIDDLTSLTTEIKSTNTYRQSSDALAYVLYTSGTTGKPKGVSVTNRNVCHYVQAFEHEFHPKAGDIMLQYSVCSFDIFVEEVFASLLNGAAIAIPSEDDKQNILRLMSFVERHQVTMISGFPYLLAEINQLHNLPSSLRLLISGGDVLRGQYVDNLVNKVEVYNTYGPSETTVCASYYRCRDGQVLADGTYPIGKPIKNVQIKLLDTQGNKVPHGEIGEICIFGDGVSNGYIGNHDKENQAFDKTSDDVTMYRSGDLGYLLDDGNIAFLRRKDTQIMIYGKRVEIMEVESVLHQCSDIKHAVVKAYTDEEGLAYMVAYIVPTNQSLKISKVRQELSQNLADFMIPKFIMKVPYIPLNENGKPDIQKIPAGMKVR